MRMIEDGKSAVTDMVAAITAAQLSGNDEKCGQRPRPSSEKAHILVG